MKFLLLALTAMATFCSTGCYLMGTDGESASGPKLAHNVFFTLATDSPENRAKLVEGCQKYLTDHPNVVYFAAGTLAEELAREVNVRDFQVGLHIVFANKQAHDDYAVSPRHQQFIDEYKALWSSVRVFDTYVE
jgi:hypothetical protein